MQCYASDSCGWSSGHYCAPCAHIEPRMLSTALLCSAHYVLIESSQLPRRGSVSRSGAIAAPPFDHLLVQLVIEMQALKDKLDGRGYGRGIIKAAKGDH